MKGSMRRVVLLSAAILAAAPASRALAGWTVVGTAVQKDGYSGIAGVKVIVMPDSVSTVTDDHGDFFLPWSGKRGWLTLQAEGTEFCKRIALHEKAKAAGDSTLDLGAMSAESTGRYFGRGKPFAPRGTAAPDTIRVAGPEAGAADRYRLAYLLVCDIWGTPTEVRAQPTEVPPPALDAAIIEWIRSVRWSVNAESPCGLDQPFRTVVPVTYWWRDGVWVLLPNAGPGRLEAPGEH